MQTSTNYHTEFAAKKARANRTIEVQFLVSSIPRESCDVPVEVVISSMHKYIKGELAFSDDDFSFVFFGRRLGKKIRLEVLKQQIFSLKRPEFLSDAIVKICFTLYREREFDLRPRRKFLFLDSNISSMGFDSFETYTDLFFHIETVFIPFRLSTNNGRSYVWVLVNVQMQSKSILVYNIGSSLATSNYITNCVKSWLMEVSQYQNRKHTYNEYNGEEWTYSEIHCPALVDAETNSGIFMLQCVERLSRNMSAPFYDSEHVHAFRFEVCLSILKGGFSEENSTLADVVN
jgi:hypothetical protein